MRIISGTARGRKLADFSGTDIRPTPDRVREALFSKLSSRLGSFNDMTILELFAGSGAQALEALSRGANSALLVDSNIQAANLINENIKRCKFESSARLLQADALTALPRLAADGPFDVIFLDPPYRRGFIPQVLEQISACQLLTADGLVCAEAAADEDIGPVTALQLLEDRKYGSTRVYLYGLPESNED